MMMVDDLEREVRDNPGNHAAVAELGRMFIELNELPAALEQIQEAIQLQPDISEYYLSFAEAFKGLGRIEEAVAACQRAVELDPDSTAAMAEFANLCAWALDRYQDAAEIYVRLIHRAPAGTGAFDYYVGLARACLRHVDLAEGLRRVERALAPLSEPMRIREGAVMALSHNGRYSEARKCCQELLKLSPQNLVALAVLAQVETEERHDLDAAQRYYSQLLELDPTNATTHLSYLMHLARRGEFLRAREHYLQVHQLPDFLQADLLGKPKWDASRLEGKTILLNGERPPGYGDSLQFGRSGLWLKELGAKVIVQSQTAIQPLVKRISGVDHVVSGFWKCPPFDYVCNLVSVWLFLDRGVETAGDCVPYLTAPQEAVESWGLKIPRNGRLRVGLAWASSERHNQNIYTQRNLPYHELSPLWDTPGVDFYSLQVDAPEGETIDHQDFIPLIKINQSISDFIDTAAITTHLDLVITVDAVVAHVAGALGRPVFLMLPFTPCWRWMLDRDDTFWYPRMRLFRQPSPGAWGSVIADVKRALESWVRP